MGKINEVIHDIHHLDAMSSQDKWMNHIHPLVKLIVTFCFIISVMSFDKYDIIGLAGMSIYLIVIAIIGDISITQSLKHVKVVLILVCAVGIANPFLDTKPITYFGEIAITSGMISMVTLMMKGIFAVLASYILIITTSIEKVCYALRILHVPKSFVTIILLIYRYIIVLLKEVERITQAYQLRAPNQKGIHIKAWGSLIGQLLLRSIDRSQIVYDSMLLRGYDGEFRDNQNIKLDCMSFLYLLFWIIIIITFRILPVFTLVGNSILA